MPLEAQEDLLSSLKGILAPYQATCYATLANGHGKGTSHSSRPSDKPLWPLIKLTDKPLRQPGMMWGGSWSIRAHLGTKSSFQPNRSQESPKDCHTSVEKTDPVVDVFSIAASYIFPASLMQAALAPTLEQTWS